MSIKKLPNGGYDIRVHGWGSERGTLTRFPPGTPYSEVKEEHDRRVGERHQAKVDEHKFTVAKLASDYLEIHGKKLSKAGLVRAAGIVREIGEDPIGAIVASELQSYHFDDWQDRLEESGDSPGTIDRKANCLRAILRHAVRRGKLEASPLRLGDLKRRVPSNKTTPVFFSVEEWTAFVTALDDEKRWTAWQASKRERIVEFRREGERVGYGLKPDSDASREYRAHLLEWKPIWWTLLLTGCRLGEILSLTWERVDLRNGVIAVEQTKTAIPKLSYVGEELREILDAIPRGLGKAYVFPRPDGEMRSNMEAQRAFAVYRELSGVRRALTIHKLRHTTASWMVQSGQSLKAVQAALGHRSINTTMKYAHLAEEHVRAAMAPVGRMAKGGAGHELNRD